MPKLLYRPDDVSSDSETEPESEMTVATRSNHASAVQLVTQLKPEPKVSKKAPKKKGKDQGWDNFVNDGLDSAQTKETKQPILEPVPSYGCTHCNMRFKRAHNLNAHLNRCSVVLAVNKLREEKLAKAEISRAKRELALKKKMGDDSIQFKAVGRPLNPKPKIGRPKKVVIPEPESETAKPVYSRQVGNESDETDCESESESETTEPVYSPPVKNETTKPVPAPPPPRDAPPRPILNPFLGNVNTTERNPRFNRHR